MGNNGSTRTTPSPKAPSDWHYKGNVKCNYCDQQNICAVSPCDCITLCRKCFSKVKKERITYYVCPDCTRKLNIYKVFD